MSEAESSSNFCHCGAKTEEDWEYCSRECGVAEAFKQLTATEVSPTPASDSDAESISSFTSEQKWWYQRTSVHELTIESLLKTLELDATTRDTQFSLPRASGPVALDETPATNDSHPDHALRRTFQAHSRNSSLDSRGSSNPYRMSGSDTSFNTPATSMDSIDSLVVIPGSPCLHRRPALANLRLEKVFPAFEPEVAQLQEEPTSQILCLDAETDLHTIDSPGNWTEDPVGESSQSISFEEDDAACPPKGNGSRSPSIHNPGPFTESPQSDFEAVRRNIFKPWSPTKHKGEKVLRVSLGNTVQSVTARASLDNEVTTPSPTSTTKLLRTLRKASSMVLANLSRQSSKRPPLVINISGMSPPASPCSSSGPDSSSPPFSTHDPLGDLDLSPTTDFINDVHTPNPRHSPCDFPTSPTASVFSIQSAAEPHSTIENTQLTVTTEPNERNTSSPTSMNSAAGRPIYLELRHKSESESTGEDGDDGWDTFVAIQRMREQWSGQADYNCWGASDT